MLEISMNAIITNLATLHHRIEKACEQARRDPASVRLLLASKTVNAKNIGVALANGASLIGENKVQELKQKCPLLTSYHPEVHFIGHLQSNKVKEALKWVSCIQSVDRLSLAEKIQRHLQLAGKTLNVLIQVNTSAEASKFGVAPEKTIALVREVAALSNIRIKGLMTIGLYSDDTEKVRACFKKLKQLQHEIIATKLPNVVMHELSMGMSGDLEIAIEEGATIIRVGSAVFGKRQ